MIIWPGGNAVRASTISRSEIGDAQAGRAVGVGACGRCGRDTENGGERRTSHGSHAFSVPRLGRERKPPRGVSTATTPTPRVGGMLLLVGAIARAHERPGEDGAEAERLALLAQPAELVRVHPAVDRRVLARRLQVLADRDHVDAVRAQLAHRLDDLVVRLAEPGDDAASSS